MLLRITISEVLRLLDAMKKDPGAEKLLQRSDFKVIYDEWTPRDASGQELEGKSSQNTKKRVPPSRHPMVIDFE